jgi:hypothetical protein
MIKYRSWPSIPEIKAVEILRETDESVFFASPHAPNNGRREAKQSEAFAYFDTFEEARQFAVTRLEDRIATLIAALDREQKKLQKIQELKP